MGQKHYRGDSDERQRETACKIRKKRSDMALQMLRDEYGQDMDKRLRPGARLDAILEGDGDSHPFPDKEP